MSDAQFRYVGNFWMIGVSYHKADLHIRERFSLSETQVESMIQAHQSDSNKGLMALCTCNRTELYGFAENAEELIDLLCHHTGVSRETWEEVGFVKQNGAAVRHLMRVGAGLESKILGDFQIIGQVKRAFDLSKNLGGTHAFLERLVNMAVEVSRRIKNETELSSGAASVSFASVQYIKQHLSSLKNVKVLVVGTGDIGRATCDNLIKHLPEGQITLMNRTPEKAAPLAKKHGLPIRPLSELAEGIKDADVVIVATGASTPTIRPSDLPASPSRTMFIDLSVPRNVDQAIEGMPGYRVTHIDELIDLTQKALELRAAEIPAAEALIKSAEKTFYKWLETRRFAPVLQALKDELLEIQRREIKQLAKKNPEAEMDQLEQLGQRMVQKITNRFAKHLHTNREQADLSLSAIQDIFDLKQIA